MSNTNNLTDFLFETANAIRAKKGTTAKINPQNFASEIASITTGGNVIVEKFLLSNGDYYTLSWGDDERISKILVTNETSSIRVEIVDKTTGKVLQYVDTHDPIIVQFKYITANNGDTDMWTLIVCFAGATAPIATYYDNSGGMTKSVVITCNSSSMNYGATVITLTE